MQHTTVTKPPPTPNAHRKRPHPRTRLLITVVSVSLVVILIAMVHAARVTENKRAAIAQYDATITPAVHAALSQAPLAETAPNGVAQTAASPLLLLTPESANSNAPLLEETFEKRLQVELDRILVPDSWNMCDVVAQFIDNPHTLNPDALDWMKRDAEFRKAKQLHGVFEEQFDPATNGLDAIGTRLAEYLYTGTAPEQSPALQELIDALRSGDGHVRWATLEDYNTKRDAVTAESFYGFNLPLLERTAPMLALALSARSVTEAQRGEIDKAVLDTCAAYDALQSLDGTRAYFGQIYCLGATRFTDKALWYLMDCVDLPPEQTETIRQRLMSRCSTEPIARFLLQEGATMERAGSELNGNAWKAKAFGDASPLAYAQELSSLLRQDLREASKMNQAAWKDMPKVYANAATPRTGLDALWNENLYGARRFFFGDNRTSHERFEADIRREWQPASRRYDLCCDARTSLGLLAWRTATREMFEVALELKSWRKTHGSYPSALDSTALSRLNSYFTDPKYDSPVRYEADATGYTVHAVPVSVAPPMRLHEFSGDVLWRSRIGEEK